MRLAVTAIMRSQAACGTPFLCAGGGRELCPDALIDDGLLDVSYVMNVSPDKIGPILGNLLDGSSTVTDMKDVFGSLRCDWLEVDCPEELQVI